MATINHKTYNEATETFKDFSVYDGKETLIFKVDGADQTVYASNIIGSGIIKTSDNGPLSATAKYLSDGLGNNSALALSTSLVGVGATTLFTKMSIANSLSATSIGTNYNAGILNIQNTNTTNGNLSLIGFQDASASINLAAVGAINTVHSASPNSVVGELGFYTKASGGGYVTERMRITSTGAVGIGTTSPATKLDVAFPSDGTAGAVFGYTGGTNNPRIFFNVNESTSKGQIIMSGSSGALDLGIGAGGTEIITLKGTGNVGIGTSAPTQPLDVNGTAIVRDQFSIRGGITGYNPSYAASYYIDNNGSTTYFNATGGNVGIGTSGPTHLVQIYGASLPELRLGDASAQIQMYTNTTDGVFGTVGGSPLVLRTNATERMRIDSSGNVGIGTSSPTRKLQVKGAVGFEATNSTNFWELYNYTDNTLRFNYNGSGSDEITITSAGLVGIGTSAPSSKLHINSASSDGIILTTTTNTEPYIAIQRNSASNGVGVLRLIDGGDLYIDNGANGASQTTKMVVKSSGNVGIGTSTPDTKLQVAGTGATGLSIRSNTSGDAFMRYYLDTVIASDAYVDRSTGNLNIRTNQNSSAIVFSTSAALIERVRITDNGLTFNGDTAAANALDDYEEGTWTPVMVGSTTAGTGTYDQQVGKYTKIGNVVRVNFSIQWTAHTGTGATVITGLPFASGAGVQTPFSVFTYGVTMTAGNVPNGGILSTGTSQWLFWQIPTGGGLSSGVPIYNGTAEIQVSGTYSV
jgi:hypothetical protein